MLENRKIAHIKASNYICEMADSFNVAGINATNGNSKVILIIGRDQLDIREETFVQTVQGQFQLQIPEEAIHIARLEFANISMTIPAAKQLVEALMHGITQAEQAQAPVA